VSRIFGASLALGIVAFAIWYGLDRVLGRLFGGQLVSVSAALAAGTGVYVGACRALHVREIEALLALRTRFSRA
jgi:hypothetical protein